VITEQILNEGAKGVRRILSGKLLVEDSAPTGNVLITLGAFKSDYDTILPSFNFSKIGYAL
jgi:hypothetical protein